MSSKKTTYNFKDGSKSGTKTVVEKSGSKTTVTKTGAQRDIVGSHGTGKEISKKTIERK